MSDKSSTLNDVDKIREIVFGGQMQSYEKRFQAAEELFTSELKKLSASTDQGIQFLEKKDSAKQVDIQNLRDDIQALKKSQQERFESLRQFFLESLANESAAAKDAVSSLSADFKDYKKTTQQRLKDLEEDMTTSYKSEIDSVRTSHLSQTDFAEALLELSFRFSNTTDEKSGKKMPQTLSPKSDSGPRS